MTRLVALAVCLAFAPTPTLADDPEPKRESADDLLAAGLAQAKKDGKAVFLSFGSPSCVWCKYLDGYHARPGVQKILGKHLAFVKVDVAETPGGQALYDKYAGDDDGVPVWVILSADGRVLADSFERTKDGKQNVGFPYEPGEVAHYRKALRAAVPKLTADEVAALAAELKEAGPDKK